MLTLSNTEVIITVDDLNLVQFAQCVDGRASILLKFLGESNEYKKANWQEWQGTIRKNSTEPQENERVMVTDQAIIFPTGTFKNPLKAQIGITATYDPVTRTANYNGVLIRIYFTNAQDFLAVKSDIEGGAFWNFGQPQVSGNLAWQYLTFRK